MAINGEVEKRNRNAVKDLMEGLEVDEAVARAAAVKWLKADVTVVSTMSGTVRLRVPAFPRAATDMRGGSR